MNFFRSSLTLVLTSLCALLLAQKTQSIDLHEAVKTGNISVYNRTLSLIDEPSYSGIRLSKGQGDGVAWLKGIELSNGVLEFDFRGETVKQFYFSGIAFHGQNDSTYEAIYLRTGRIRDMDETIITRCLLYVSLPAYTWRRLRKEFRFQYEEVVEPAADPTGWERMRVEIQGDTITSYINGKKEASLTVRPLGGWRNGAIGFYVAGTSGGEFANISVTWQD